MNSRKIVERDMDNIHAGENWNFPAILVILGTAKLLSVGFQVVEIAGKGAGVVKREFINTFSHMDED